MKRKGIYLFLAMMAFGMFMLLADSPNTIAQGGGTYCDEGKEKYCWTSLPKWECLPQVGGIHCVDKPVY